MITTDRKVERLLLAVAEGHRLRKLDEGQDENTPSPSEKFATDWYTDEHVRTWP